MSGKTGTVDSNRETAKTSCGVFSVMTHQQQCGDRPLVFKPHQTLRRTVTARLSSQRVMEWIDTVQPLQSLHAKNHSLIALVVCVCFQSVLSLQHNDQPEKYRYAEQKNE